MSRDRGGTGTECLGTGVGPGPNVMGPGWDRDQMSRDRGGTGTNRLGTGAGLGPKNRGPDDL